MIGVKFTEADSDRAHEEWGCNCGPGALAAMLGVTLDAVRPLIPEFETKRYTSPTMMFAALRNSGCLWQRSDILSWPSHGLVRIQWEGPWMAANVPARARYAHTHWIGAMIIQGQVGVFDINCMNNGLGWVSLEDWTMDIAPFLIANTKRATGKWHITHVIEVKEL